MSFEPITNPTWEYPIKSFFNAIDINHMLAITQGTLNLGKYEDVVSSGEEIYRRVESGNMPEPPSPKWSTDMVQLFKTWMDNGYPETDASS